MADHDDRRVGLLGVFLQQGGAFADLRDAARRRVDRVGIDRLDRVDDDQIGSLLVDLAQDVLHVRLAVYVALVVADAEPLRPHLDLLGRFLARNVQRFQAVCAQRDLQAQRRFADAQLAAQQDHRAPDQSPAEHPVHLGAGEVEPPLLALLYFPDALGFRPGPVACQSGYGRGVLAGDHFLREGVPRPARRTVPEPFRSLESALLAEICLFDFGHVVSVVG